MYLRESYRKRNSHCLCYMVHLYDMFSQSTVFVLQPRHSPTTSDIPEIYTKYVI